MPLFRSKDAGQPTAADAPLLRDGLLWLLRRRDWGASSQRLAQLEERLRRFPSPTGLVRELEKTIPAAPPPRRAEPAPPVQEEDPALRPAVLSLLRAIATVMGDAALMDSQLQNSIRAFGDSLPRRLTLSDLKRLEADTGSLDAAARRARRAEYQRRKEVTEIVAALAKALDEHTSQTGRLSERLEDLVQTLWALPDIDGMRDVRRQVSGHLQGLSTEARTLRESLEGARSRAAALEHLVEEQEERIGDLETKATLDPLTGVANRGCFNRWLPRRIETNLASDSPFALVIVDFDHFKALNDTWGHPAGDRALTDAVQAMAATIRQDDTLARIGGEEFAVMIQGAVPNVARLVAERLRASVSQVTLPNTGDAQPQLLTASAGLANLRPGDSAESLYARADRALYAAKRAGRDRLIDDQGPS
ncbi:MAG: GGDEF domain-containing protein [Pseudomonadota bacterium]